MFAFRGLIVTALASLVVVFFGVPSAVGVLYFALEGAPWASGAVAAADAVAIALGAWYFKSKGCEGALWGCLGCCGGFGGDLRGMGF